MPHDSCRIRTMVMVSMVALGGAGCSDDEEQVPGPAPDVIATPEQVRAHLTFVASQVPISRPQPAVSLPPFTCTTSGTREVSTGSVESPFAQGALASERIRYQDCMQYDGPAQDPDSSFLRLHGIEETARLQQPNGTIVTYLGSGAASDAPLQRQRRAVQPEGIYEEDHYFFGQVHRSERTTFFGLLRRVDATVFTLHDLSIRYPDGARFEGSYRFGTAATPLRIESRNEQTLIDGGYEIDTARCRTGAMQVQTLRDLAYDANTDRFVAGSLRFSAEGGSATATFNADGTVRLTGAGGEELLEPWAPGVHPWSSGCFAAEDP